MASYAAQTVDSPNPVARYAHRSRLKRSLALTLAHLGEGMLLDYGCGSGAFLAQVLSRRPGRALGYEPYMVERVGKHLPIHGTLAPIESSAPYALITLFETIEHLTDAELEAFLSLCSRLLTASGGILISAPIEIGPALILKELNRSVLRLRLPEHHALEFIRASLFGIPARRAPDIKTSHRGFDFRRAREVLARLGWRTRILSYGPLPLVGWYGNSQVYMWAHRA
jgi:cyclopropane fatty-acyl-phospholipid synthase-like methyltransferase